MLALPLTPKSPRAHSELDRGSPFAPKMGVPSYERPSSPSVFATSATAMRQTSQKRPKLSLQTSSLPLPFGKSSTALAITASALPTASPTLLNTFSNAYEIPHRFSPATASPTGTRSARPPSRLVSPFVGSKDDRPYQVPLGLKGILRNSPVSSNLRKSSFCTAGDSPRTGRRPFFPIVKKATFRTILEEEIKTATYVAKHSDLSSDEDDSDSDEYSELSMSSSDDSGVDETPNHKRGGGTSQPRKKRKIRSNRQIEAAAIRDCVGGAETIPKRLKPTFGAKKKPRRRRWEWTLEPFKAPGTQADTKLQVSSSSLSPSQIPLPLSAAFDGAEALPSPCKVPLPLSATSPAPAETKAAAILPSPALIPLPSSATLCSSPWGTKPVEDDGNAAAEHA